jgi:hypothetical protein
MLSLETEQKEYPMYNKRRKGNWIGHSFVGTAF